MQNPMEVQATDLVDDLMLEVAKLTKTVMVQRRQIAQLQSMSSATSRQEPPMLPDVPHTSSPQHEPTPSLPHGESSDDDSW